MYARHHLYIIYCQKKGVQMCVMYMVHRTIGSITSGYVKRSKYPDLPPKDMDFQRSLTAKNGPARPSFTKAPVSDSA